MPGGLALVYPRYKLPTIVIAQRPKPRSPEPKPAATALRITYARKPGKNFGRYRKPQENG
jgi:hypothetical protein